MFRILLDGIHKAHIERGNKLDFQPQDTLCSNVRKKSQVLANIILGELYKFSSSTLTFLLTAISTETIQNMCVDICFQTNF